MEVVDKKIGENLEVKVEIAEAQVKLEVDLSLLPLVQLVADKLKEIIPGHIEDALLDSAVEALKAKLAAPVA